MEKKGKEENSKNARAIHLFYTDMSVEEFFLAGDPLHNNNHIPIKVGNPQVLQLTNYYYIYYDTIIIKTHTKCHILSKSRDFIHHPNQNKSWFLLS